MLSQKLFQLIKRVTNRSRGHFHTMATLDGLITSWFKTLKLKVGCVLISEIEFQMSKKDIKLQLQVSVKILDQ